MARKIWLLFGAIAAVFLLAMVWETTGLSGALLATHKEDTVQPIMVPVLAAPGYSNPCNPETRNCSDAKNDFQLTYPPGWHIVSSEDNLANGGMWGFYNFPDSEETGNSVFAPGKNKIELAISPVGPIDYGGDGYIVASEHDSSVVIAGQAATRVEIRYQAGDSLLAYRIPLANATSSVLDLTIYGDPANYGALDTMAKSVRPLH